MNPQLRKLLNMAKRFTSTEKWDKVWFQELPVRLKCFWQYMTDRCDHAGVWEANYRMASFCIGEEVTEGDLGAFGERVERLGDDKIYLRGFVTFQYGELSPRQNCHKSVIKLLEKHNLPINQRDVSTLDEPLTKGSARDMDKDKDKDKVKAKINKPLPEGWEPNQNHSQYCQDNRLDMANAVELLKDWALGGNHKRADWDRVFSGALRTWLPEKIAKMPASKLTNYGPNGLPKEVIMP